MTLDLAFVWALLIALAVFMYVVMDGFDLGIGILFPSVRDERHRDTMVNSVAPVWDGNETWLILGGGGLYAVFPLAYSVLLTAFYAPLIAMLLALVFRGVAFEFRFKTRRGKPYWDIAFALGSTVAAFCQGVMLGAFIQGIAIDGRSYAGGWFDWLTPFSLFTGFAVVTGYALLGATWLIMKTEGALQAAMYRRAIPLLVLVAAAILVTSLWTPLFDARIAARWFSWPNLLILAPVPLLVAALCVQYVRAIRRRREVQPFLIALGLFTLSYMGFGISLYPRIIPPNVTIWQAAAPDASLGFLLVGAVILLPIILGYTGYAYWVFRGKVRPDEGYH